MKSPAGQPRARRPAQKNPVQLNLRRTPTWPEEDELDEPRGNFWKWFVVVLLLHVFVLAVLLLVFHSRAPKPPPEFIESFQPAGDMAKGTAGKQSAPKIAPTTAAPSHPAAAAPVPPTPTPVKPPPVPPKVEQVKPPTPKPVIPPIIKDTATKQVTPVKPPPVKPPPPKPKPKIKIDLSHLVEMPAADQPPPKAKPKMHPKKVVKPSPEKPTDADESDNHGLSKEQVAQELGSKLKAAGVEQGTSNGPNGSTHSKASDFGEFYQSIHDQVMGKWSVPNLTDETAIDPIVRIHVEQDGRVPPDRVTLERSSNNPAFDQSALEAARGMGYTLQPLPDHCPPDISIVFNLRQQ